MKNKLVAVVILGSAACLAGLAVAEDMAGMSMAAPGSAATQPSTQPMQANDVRNTICPVSGDTVSTSTLVEVYDGKVYHLCCADCHTDFEKDPAKYAKIVADSPAKYGVK